MSRGETDGAAVRGGPQAIDDESFARIARMVREEAGIVLNYNKRSLIVSRLGRRLRTLGLADFRAYCSIVERDGSEEERREMLFLLTTNVTRFFREPHHFDVLRADIVPRLAARARDGGRVRIWSAGCSSGEEPYSIAMTVLDVMPDAARHDLRILATDLDANMIAAGRRALYRGIDRAQVPEAMLRKYFEKVDGDPEARRVAPGARALVQFAELNLLHPWPMKGRFDVIFCRNVVIYFDGETQTALWSRFADVLQHDGHLFVGHSERVVGPANSCLRGTGVTQYARTDTAAADQRKELLA